MWSDHFLKHISRQYINLARGRAGCPFVQEPEFAGERAVLKNAVDKKENKKKIKIIAPDFLSSLHDDVPLKRAY